MSLFALEPDEKQPESLGNFFFVPRFLYDPAGVWADGLFPPHPEERWFYDMVQAGLTVPRESATLTPYPFYDTLPFLKTEPPVELYLKGTGRNFSLVPLQSWSLKTYYASRDGLFVPGFAGTLLEKGLNLFMFEDGTLSIQRRFGIYWQFRHIWQSGSQKHEVFRAYAKIKLGKFSLEGGRDSVNIGPGTWGLLLSSHADPFWMIKLQTDEPLELYGKWHFMILNGWLLDERVDHSDPMLLAMRLTYQPFSWLELGGTRTELYGGRGRPYYRVQDIPMLFLGMRDNVPGDRFDNDGYFAWDLVFHIPLYKLIPAVTAFDFYYQEAGTDMGVSWQPEDDYLKPPFFIFHLYERAYQVGLFLSTEHHRFRLEYAKTAMSYYNHPIYNVEGYSYNGMILGHPGGGNMQSLLFRHHWQAHPNVAVEYETGIYQQNAHTKPDHRIEFPIFPLFTTRNDLVRRFYGEINAELTLKNWRIGVYLRLDGGTRHDSNPLPNKTTVTTGSTLDTITGISVFGKF